MARTILRLTLIVAVPSTVLAILLSPLIAGPLLGSPDAPLLLITTFIAGLLLDLALLYGAYFLGAGRYADTVYQNILYAPLSRGVGLALAILGLRVQGIILGWAVGGLGTLLLSLYLWRGRLPHGSHQPVKPLLVFTLPLFTSSLITLGQQWGDITILQARLGQLSTTGAYYLIVSSVAFLSILWTPVATALLPSLSAAHASEGSRGVQDRLSIATRLTNLAVLPLAASLAAVAPTALTVVYGPAYAAEAWPFAILSLASVFTAQAAILTVTFQAVGKTREFLRTTFIATIVDLATVSITATYVGPAAGALGRALLYITIVYLGHRALRPELDTRPYADIVKALTLALGVSLPLFAADQLMIRFAGLRPLLAIPVLLAVFTSSFLAVSRRLHAFHAGDFSILKDALPRRFHPYLRRIERLVLG